MANNDVHVNLKEIRENFYKFASRHYKQLSNERMGKLMNIHFDIECPQELNLPNLNEIEVLSEQDKQDFKDKLRKRIKLFELLERKNRCLISKIVDEI